MAASEGLRPQVDQLARLLADGRGAEVLAELQSLTVQARSQELMSTQTAADDLLGGIWRVERTAAGAGLRRAEMPQYRCHWADVDYVPPPGGARRVVVMGESLGRGGSYEPVLTPTGALAGYLERAAPGGYQCVDLAKAGATVEALTRLTAQLPLADPDVVVVIAGNNFAQTSITGGDGAAGDEGLGGALASALGVGGYAAMRRMFIDRAVLPRARCFLDGLLMLAGRGVRVVIVVPEFNLQGWMPPLEVEAPVLAAGELGRWYELRAMAERAAAAGDWERVRAMAGEMAELDGGASPVPGQLLAQAGIAVGDGASARAGLEASRDALAGLGLPWCTPRIIAEVATLLTDFATGHGFGCVDLRTVLAAGDGLGLPDPALFHDYCHLTDAGMELMMSAVADAITGQPPGTTSPGPGVAPELQSFMHLTAAALSAFCGQPASIVGRYLRAAVGADPQMTAFLAALLEVIEGVDPRWTHTAIQPLAAGAQHLAGVLGQVMLRHDAHYTMWALRAALWDVLGTTPSAADTQIDLLASRWPANGQTYQRSTSQRQQLGFALHQPMASTADLTYRMPHAPAGSTARVCLNGQPVATLTATTRWTTTALTLPAQATRTGMNWLHIHWPIPAIDTTSHHATATAALDRDTFPDILPIFGELFDARITPAHSIPAPAAR